MTTRAVPLVLAAVLVAGCGTKSPATPPAPAGKHVDPATAGSISGTVMFAGARPAPTHLRMGSDEACVQASGPSPLDDAVVIAKNGALANVFVYIKDGLDPSYTYDLPTTSVRFDQKGCRYQPRVVGVRVGQSVEFVNHDQTMHNVHAMPMHNPEFNESLLMEGSRMTKTFNTPEVMVRFKCNVHSWMLGWIGVVAHPYFAVTKPDGSFTLEGVPPGTYTIEAWHERYGTQTTQVTVGDKEAKTVAFSFAAKAATHP